MIAKLAGETLGFRITWMGWFAAASVPALVSLSLSPLLIYRWLEPERKGPRMRRASPGELEKMGPMAAAEWRMVFVFAGTLVLWATGQ